MKDKLIESLQTESQKIDAKAIDTVRYPKEIEKEMAAFCKEHKVQKSVVLRRCIILGWKEMTREPEV